MIRFLPVSSLEKAFLEDSIDSFKKLTSLTVLQNEVFSFQLLYTETEEPGRKLVNLHVESDLPVEASTVELVPVRMPCYENGADDNYLCVTPGLYPDYLRELHYENALSVMKNQLSSVWFTVKKTEKAGTYPITVRLTSGDTLIGEATVSLTVLPHSLPKQDFAVSQWLHLDCLATYYRVPVFSEEHWKIIENFAGTARENGINTVLVPLLTPPLDTKVGGERPTVQLLDITLEKGIYSFGFAKLDRYLQLMNQIGMEHFEIAHFFTQWGAAHAPKVMATVKNDDGTTEYRRIFGWETDAAGKSYRTFLRAMLRAFLAHMQERGEDKKCIFHISDEPSEQHLEQYRKAKSTVADLLQGYPVMDALSNYEFYKQGICDHPIPASNHIEPFLAGGVKNLWTYYCCSQYQHVSNRFIAMPAWRNRCIAMAFFKYRIAGFLQWGYNFYYNQFSVNPINPYADNSGEFWVPAGDPFSVYPAMDGTPYVSTRLVVFHEALQDLAAMKLCETLYGHDRVVWEMEKIVGEIRFSHCVTSAEPLLQVRKRINEMIQEFS